MFADAFLVRGWLVPMLLAAPLIARSQDAPPATVEAAAAVLSLETLPLVAGAETPSNRCLAGLSYQAKSTIKEGFAFHKKQLEARGFSELPNATVTDEYASSTFGKDGFRIAVAVMPFYGKPGSGQIGITLQNLGNVELGSLPVPAGVKPLYEFPATRALLTDLTPDEAAAKVGELFTSDGWERYGSAGDVQFFRKNAVRVTAQVAAAPAQQGKTAITYTAELLSAELPAPPDATRVQYSDSTKQLSIDTPATADQVVDYYRDRLAPTGWKATTDRPVVDRFQSFLIFRNPAGELLELTLAEVDELRRVKLRHQSAAEVEAESLKAKALAEAAKMKKDAPNPKVTIELPVGAKVGEPTARSIEFTVAAGSARALVISLGKTLTAEGWKESVSSLDPMAGALGFTKGRGSISIDYIDIGLGPAEISITGIGVELEAAK